MCPNDKQTKYYPKKRFFRDIMKIQKVSNVIHNYVIKFRIERLSGQFRDRKIFLDEIKYANETYIIAYTLKM